MRKLANKRGFTLVEMLTCVITLLLIGLICSSGINLAMHSLAATSFDSDSQMLESTMDIYISDILRHAVLIQETSEGIKFNNDAYYIREGMLKVDTTGSRVAGAGYLVYTTEHGAVSSDLMIANKGAYVDNLYIKNFVLDYDQTTGIFSGSYQIVSSAVDSVRTCTFRYRTITQNVH